MGQRNWRVEVVCLKWTFWP